MGKKPSILLSALAVLTLSATGCKKKEPDAAAVQKATEGSGAAVVAGSAAPTPTPNEGSAVAAAGGNVAEPAAAGAETKSLLDTAKAAGTFTTFLKAVDAAGLTERLSGPGPFTVFAPTDEAFAKLPPKDLEALLSDKTKLEALLQNHVIAGSVLSKDLAAQKSLKSVQGGELLVDASSGIKISGATVTKPDIAASNGVIHVIDTVITK